MKYLSIIKIFALALFFYSVVTLALPALPCKTCDSTATCDGGQSVGWPDCVQTLHYQNGVYYYSCETSGVFHTCGES